MIKFTKEHLLAMPDMKNLIASLSAEIIGTACLTFYGCLTLLNGFTLLSSAIGWGILVGHLVMVGS